MRFVGGILVVICFGLLASCSCGRSHGRSDDADAEEASDEVENDLIDVAAEDVGEEDLPDEADVPDEVPVETDLQISLLWNKPDLAIEIIDEDENLFVSIPYRVSPATDHLLAFSLDAGAEDARTLDVLGDPPYLRVVGGTFDPVSSRLLILACQVDITSMGGLIWGDSMELLEVRVEGSTATVDVLPSVSPPEARPFWERGLAHVFPVGDGARFRAFMDADSSFDVEIRDGVATWEPEAPISLDAWLERDTWWVHDPTGHRLRFYGELVDEPGDATVRWFEPTVLELELDGGYAWNRITTGAGPVHVSPSEYLVTGSGIWDDQGDRMLVLQEYRTFRPYLEIWALSSAGEWTRLRDELEYLVPPQQHVTDHESRRTLFTHETELRGLSIAPGTEGDLLVYDLESALDPVIISAVLDSSRDRIIAGGIWTPWDHAVMSISLEGQNHVWERVDVESTWPVDCSGYYKVAIDEATDRLILVCPETLETLSVYSMDLSDPLSWTLEATTGTAPVRRHNFSMYEDEARRKLYIVGGMWWSGSPVVVHSDVVSLDLETMEWQHEADLPQGRYSPLLFQSADGTGLYVMFGKYYVDPSDIESDAPLLDAYRIDLTSGVLDSLVVSGDMPREDARKPVGIDLSSGYSFFSPHRYETDVFDVVAGDGSLTLTRSSLYEHPEMLRIATSSVGSSGDVAYVVGNVVWQVSR